MAEKLPWNFLHIFILTCIFFSSCLVNSTSALSLENDPQINETLNWDAPYHIKKNFPYFLSGFDNDGSPIWVIEFGSWKIRSFLEKGTKEDAEDLNKYAFQFLYRMHQSTYKYKTEYFMMLADLNGYENRDFAHLASLNLVLNMIREFIRISSMDELRMKKGVGVNANYVASTLFQFVQPLLTNELKSIAYIYGTNAEKWKILLLKEIPRSSLPDWLGGDKSHKALEVYG